MTNEHVAEMQCKLGMPRKIRRMHIVGSPYSSLNRSILLSYKSRLTHWVEPEIVAHGGGGTCDERLQNVSGDYWGF